MGIGDGSASERGESHSHSLTKQQLKNPPNEVLVRGGRPCLGEWRREGGRMLRVEVDKNSARIRPPWPPPPPPDGLLLGLTFARPLFWLAGEEEEEEGIQCSGRNGI